MTEGIDEDFAATVLSDDLLNKVTFGNGTTAIRQAIATWPVDRLFYDTDKKNLFRNAGTLNNVIWKHASKNIGTIELFAGPAASIPEGALICNGASVSRATYADLFGIIGTDFGAGDNGNEFKIPDFRDRIPRGSSDDTDHGSQGGNRINRQLTNYRIILIIDAVPNAGENNPNQPNANVVRVYLDFHNHTYAEIWSRS